MKFMCSPSGSATINSLMNVATLLFDTTVHSYSLMSSTSAGTLMSRSPFTFTWQASRQLSLISLRVKCTASVGRISPPPSVTRTLHWPQLPLPPQAEGRKTFSVARAERSGRPDSTLTLRSSLMVTVTLPELTRKCLATRSTITSRRVITKKIPIPDRRVAPMGDVASVVILLCC